jgi:hypothetical protein
VVVRWSHKFLTGTHAARALDSQRAPGLAPPLDALIIWIGSISVCLFGRKNHFGGRSTLISAHCNLSVSFVATALFFPRRNYLRFI